MTCVLFFARLDQPLLEPEEGRYAEIPRQMLVQGRFLTPVLHGEDYWQKPPLLYWLVMASYQIFGAHDWSARLVPALAGILSVIITTGWAWRMLGFWTGLVSGAILTLSLAFNNDGPLGSFFRYICDNGTYKAFYDDLSDGKDNKIDVSKVDVSMDGIELEDREFIAAIREKREPNASLQQVLPCMHVLGKLERIIDPQRKAHA